MCMMGCIKYLYTMTIFIRNDATWSHNAFTLPLLIRLRMGSHYIELTLLCNFYVKKNKRLLQNCLQLSFKIIF